MRHAQSIQQVLLLGTSQSMNSSETISNGVNASALTLTLFSQPENLGRRTARRLWFSDLLSKLATFRGIRMNNLEEQMFLAELEAMRFTQDQAKLAELWILYGDWKFKGKDARLEMSDFFPEVSSVQHVLEQRELAVVKLSDYQASIRKARESGMALRAPETVGVDEKFSRIALESVQLKADLLEALDEVAKLKAELTRKNHRIVTLENRTGEQPSNNGS